MTRRHLIIYMAGCLTVSLNAAGKKTPPPPYRDVRLTVEERLSDLLGRMTIEEKVGQLRCTMAWNYYTIRDGEVEPSEQFKRDVAEGCIGMLWATYRADPWTQKTIENGLNPELAAKAGNALQRYVREHTRLGIPLLLCEEAPHGHMAIGTTVLPTGLGMAATWSPALIEQAGRVIGREIRLQGGHASYGPVLDLAREPRWSRVEETMGEDPVLSGTLGAAMVRGLGGGDLTRPGSTIATLKHFIGYGTTEGGQNGGPTVAGRRDIAENFLPPFRQAIEAGALSVMTSYNSLDGIPSTANGALLTDLLRGEWGFRGFVVSDLYSIDGLCGTHHTARNPEEAATMALSAGVDADLGANCYARLTEAVRAGRVSEAAVDSAVARILRLKFEMGLFDRPYVDPKAARQVRSEAARQTALDVARASVTLLKNEAGLLPLDKRTRVLVCGPNADNVYNQLGDYTAPQADGAVTTLLGGIREKIGTDRVAYVKGCAIRDTTASDIAAAVRAAQEADVVIVAVGGSSARDFKTSYKDTGAAETDSRTLSDMDCGEGFDRASLSLLGHQQRLLEALKTAGKPMVVVYIEGRPMDKRWAAAHADALLTAYYPGEVGGKAIADVVFGDYNPAGRLPVSVPASTGQLPVYYNRKAPAAHDYVEMPARPLYAFGYGLSFTTFRYDSLRIERLGDTTFRVEADVTNTGSRDGDEVVQLYLRDEVASTVRPLLQLKRFERVHIPKGETRRVAFTLTADDLAIVDSQMRRTVEPGDFTVLIGSSSDRILLQQKITISQ